MRIKTRKTWSQQELATKLRFGQLDDQELLNWERRRLLIHAAKTALAAALCWWLALRFGLHDGYWGAISAIIVLQSNFGATITASRDRIFGTLIGALFGFSFSLFGALPWNYILAVFAAVVVCGLLGMRHRHNRNAGPVNGFSLESSAGPRERSISWNCGGPGHLHACIPRSSAPPVA
jgi:uncharacterized membrane protein YccC